ncbi:tetratricopeptide repeat protein [Parvularcula oceani]|uniref:tetratricopeptide repeat protein n=1 Tax=Parvularcula oceani TaxID=1247963 RepID=UPI0004E206D5|nr:tetratricopeptide repeat protein [Parvularcula oceani]
MMTTRKGLKRHLLAGAGALLLLAACESKEEQAIKFAESGQEYLDQGDLTKAELQFNNALFKDPVNIEALRGAALIAEEKDQAVRQARMLSRLLAERPDDIPANLAFARLSLLGGSAERALEHAERVLAQRPEDAEALTIKGAALVVDNKLAEATEVLNRALEQDPDNAEIFNLLAAGDIRSDNYQQALQRVNEGIAQAENPETLLIVKLILAERLLGEEEVVDTFEQLIEAAPENGTYRQRLADYYLLRLRDYDTARRLYTEALPFVTDKTPLFTRIVSIDRETEGDEAAERTLRRFIEENPANEDLRFSLPIFYCQTEQPEACQQAFEQLAGDETLSEEQRLRARIGLSDVAMSQGQIERAESLTEAILAEDAENVAALTNKAQILMTRDQAEEAIPLLRTALNNQPDNAEALVFLALAYENTGQEQFADAQFARAVDEVGYTKIVSDQYRQFLQRRGESRRASEVLERYIAQNPGDTSAVLQKAQSDLGAGDYRTALETASRLIEAGVDTRRAERVRLAALVGLERWDEALPLSETLVQAAPDDRRLLAMRARILAESGAPEEAFAALEARLDRQDAVAADYILLGEALLREEEQARAADVAQRGIQAFPRSEDLHIVRYLAEKDGGPTQQTTQILREGAEQAENSRRIRTLLSNDLIVLGETDEAIEVLRSLEQDELLDPLTANNLASLLLEREGNEEEALRIAERFRRTENPYFADTLAWAYYQNDRLEDAARYSRIAAEGAPENADILYHRGVIAAAQGDMPSARSALTSAKRNMGATTQVAAEEIDAALERL